jgi:hypothetical protein
MKPRDWRPRASVRAKPRKAGWRNAQAIPVEPSLSPRLAIVFSGKLDSIAR